MKIILRSVHKDSPVMKSRCSFVGQWLGFTSRISWTKTETWAAVCFLGNNWASPFANQLYYRPRIGRLFVSWAMFGLHFGNHLDETETRRCSFLGQWLGSALEISWTRQRLGPRFGSRAEIGLRIANHLDETETWTWAAVCFLGSVWASDCESVWARVRL